jgi:hypothetical protein
VLGLVAKLIVRRERERERERGKCCIHPQMSIGVVAKFAN